MAIAENDLQKVLEELFELLKEKGYLDGLDTGGDFKKNVVEGLMKTMKESGLDNSDIKDPQFAIKLCVSIVNQSVMEKYHPTLTPEPGQENKEIKQGMERKHPNPAEQVRLKNQMQERLKLLLDDVFPENTKAKSPRPEPGKPKNNDDLAEDLAKDGARNYSRASAPRPKEEENEIAQVVIRDATGTVLAVEPNVYAAANRAVETIETLRQNNEKAGTGLVAGVKDQLDTEKAGLFDHVIKELDKPGLSYQSSAKTTLTPPLSKS